MGHLYIIQKHFFMKNEINFSALFMLCFTFFFCFFFGNSSFSQWSTNINGIHSTPPSGSFVGINNSMPGTFLHVNGTAELSLASPGLIILGPGGGDHISIDANEIQAKNGQFG